MSTYAVGDIQGCLYSLERLLASAQFNPRHDTLWLAGDLVNRGPQSLETLRFVKALGASAITVLGNHDLHLLACWHGVRSPGRKDTLDEILNAPDCDELLLWLQDQSILHVDRTLGYAMCHAGIPAIWSLKKAERLAAKLESALHGKQASEFFNNMYGNAPDTWSDDLGGFEELRLITNYFTRMRFCQKDGRLDFDSKGDPGSPPEGFKPWFEFKNKNLDNCKILFGHWAALLGDTGDHATIALDTGCVWGAHLTMMCLENGEVFCEDCSLYSRPNLAQLT
ncbi:MAG: bis(5'-nucleosyl)-tetraphosphatase (symmetrical) [Flavobacteriales bacterium]|jgi:bis(5'-nucleosyl)-tetraphosphatase (symmetrical)